MDKFFDFLNIKIMTPKIKIARKVPAIEWMIFFFFNWEKIIQGRKIKENDRNPITKVIAAAGSWNAFNIHPVIIINDDIRPIFSIKLNTLLIY